MYAQLLLHFDPTEAFKTIENIFKDVLDNQNISLKKNDTPENIEDWDSIANINIIIDSQETARIQEAHTLIGHILCEMVEHLIRSRKL